MITETTPSPSPNRSDFRFRQTGRILVALLASAIAVDLGAMGSKAFWEEDAVVDNDEWTIFDLKGEERRDKARSALNDAVVRGQIEVVGMLLEKGADINAREKNGWTALHWAIHYKRADIAKLLVEKGADINALSTDGYGWTPLTMAIRQKMDDTSKLLIEKGADVNMRTDGGKTAISMALKANQPDLAKRMIERNIFLAGSPRSTKYPIVIAHRGASAHHPENTLPAFEAAVEAGATMIELDVRLSKDGELVVIHDETLDRTTNGRGPVREQTLRELKELDAGSWFDDSFKGVRIPTLEDVLDAVGDKILINVEIKKEPADGNNGIEEKVLDLLERKQRMNSVIVSSFDFQVLRNLRNRSKKIHLSLLAEGPEHNLGIASLAKGVDAFSYNPEAKHVTQELVERLHFEGILVMPWSEAKDNTRETMEAMKKLEVDGFFANDPALLDSIFRSEEKGKSDGKARKR